MFIVLFASTHVVACLWDRDTLATEARGLPGIAEILTGRFERQPPLYYHMRLDRVIKELAANPAGLGAYDDAAVACERLDRDDEGIEWMRRKKDQLNRLDPANPEVRDHLYKYEANLGTILLHRWFRAGARRDALQDLKDGRDHIAAAIAINPDAHFGREKYQLMAMEWLLDDSADSYRSPVPTLLDLADAARPYAPGIPTGDRSNAAQGLAGLIALGFAWESFDVTYALGLALDGRGDAALATVARLRCEELLKAGHASVHPSAASSEEIHSSVSAIGQTSTHIEDIQAFYSKARAAAEDWVSARAAFMNSKLTAGMHPDTHPDFWAGYSEPRPPPFPSASLSEIVGEPGVRNGVLIAATCAAAGGVILIFVRRGTWRARLERERAA